MQDYWFFLSYARVDGKGNSWIEKFYLDLAGEVRRSAPLGTDTKEGDIGFYDVESIETGDYWDQKLVKGIQSCRVLVCLYSPAYFYSEFCGKEFQVFSDRVYAYNNQNPPPLIIPVLWDNPDQFPKPLPMAVKRIQFEHKKLGETYVKQGLEVLVRNQKYQDDYQEFLKAFGDLVAEAGKTYHPLKPLPNFPSFDKARSAFEEKEKLSQEAERQSQEGLKVVKVIFVAGQGAEFEANKIKKELDAYTITGGPLWRPYYPDDYYAANFTGEVAKAENLTLHPILLNDDKLDFIKEIRKAERDGTMVVIIVDPWSVQIQRYKNYMKDYDAQRFFNCGVIVVWNENDNETKLNKETLRREVETTFERLSLYQDTYFRSSISSPEELKKELTDTIYKIRDMISRQGQLRAHVKSTSGESFPMLNSPQGE
jgi:FxsC-like protein